MRQQLLVDLHPFTLQRIDRSFHIDGIPQRDSCRQQRQSTGAIALIFRFSVPDFTQPVQEYRTRQRVTGYKDFPGMSKPVFMVSVCSSVKIKGRDCGTINGHDESSSIRTLMKDAREVLVR